MIGAPDPPMPVASPPYGSPGRAIGSAVNMFNPGCVARLENLLPVAA
jgi:hypothetical protein